MTLFQKRTAVLLGCIGLVGALPYQGASAETLMRSMTAALEHHPSVEGALEGINAAEESESAQYSNYFPEISVNGTGGRVYGDNATSRGLSVTRGDGYSYLWDGSISATQRLFDGFETSSRVDSAEAKIHSATYSLEDTKENLALRVAQVYSNLLRSRTGLSLLAAQHKKIKGYIDRIETLVREGAADKAELEQARDIQMQIEGLYADYKGQVRSAEADYMEAVGREPAGALELPKPRLELIPSDITVALEHIKTTHPALKAAMYFSDSARYDISAERAELYPDLTGELSYAKTDKKDIIGGESEDGRAVVRMSWNFSTGGAQLARIKKKKHEHQVSLARMKEMQRQVERAVRIAYAEKEISSDQFYNLVKRTALSERLFETYKTQFDGARISLLQLMQADNQLFNTRLEKLNNEYRVLAANYAVLASLGMLQDSLFNAKPAGAAEVNVDG